jgi:lysine-N-methylase
MRLSPVLRPTYSDRFHCLGSECEETCCAYWQVHFDPETVKKYRDMDSGPLQDLILSSLESPRAGTARPGDMNLRMGPDGTCPLLNEQRLCRIQIEMGAGYLSHICLSYPRQKSIIDGQEEVTLTLSCPEAARLILLEGDLLAPPAEDPLSSLWDDSGRKPLPPLAFFWPIREFIVRLLLNRRYPLWQRLFLIGSFCRRLDASVQDPSRHPIPVLLREFPAAVESGQLRPAMDQIPADHALQLDLLLNLIFRYISRNRISRRFEAVLRAFTAAIGLKKKNSMQELTPPYASAIRQSLAPFTEKHPQFFENLLLNTVLYECFPFGRTAADPSLPIEASRNFARLATQFALIRGLLAGLARSQGAAFEPRMAAAAVQSIWKHFEHNALYLEESQKLLQERGVNDTRGLTMLIRD